jgi:gas vesicle protein
MYRYEEEATGGSFLLGLLAGVVLGAGVGLLFAPRTGAETRRRMSDSAHRMREQATEGYGRASETVSGIVERGRDTYDRARQTVSRGVEEVRRYTNDATNRVSEAGAQVAEKFEEVTAARRS